MYNNLHKKRNNCYATISSLLPSSQIQSQRLNPYNNLNNNHNTYFSNNSSYNNHFNKNIHNKNEKKKSQVKESKELLIMHWNCNSLLEKFIEFCVYVEEKKPDIILLYEIKASQEITNSELNLKGYFLESKIREKNPKHGGGVAIYVKEGIIYDRILDFEPLKLELICLRIKTLQGLIYVIAYYNPPDQTFSSDVFKILKNLKAKLLLIIFNCYRLLIYFCLIF
jgi:hypothetical protein